MHHPATWADVAGQLAGLWIIGGFVTFLYLVLLWPFMLLIITLNIRGIRKELREIAEQLSLPSRRL